MRNIHFEINKKVGEVVGKFFGPQYGGAPTGQDYVYLVLPVRVLYWRPVETLLQECAKRADPPPHPHSCLYGRWIILRTASYSGLEKLSLWNDAESFDRKILFIYENMLSLVFY